jgi:hypothetical protein
MKHSSIQKQILLISICCALMFVQVSARRKKKQEPEPNLALLPGVVASQSADCGPKRAPKYASGAIDGSTKTYAYTCRHKRSKEPEWFNLKLENGESVIQKIEIIATKKKKKTLKNTNLTIRDEYGDIVESLPINVGGKKKGSVIVDFGEGITGHQITIERFQGSRSRKMKLAEFKVLGFVPELPDYYSVTGLRGCASGKSIQKQSQCRTAGEAIGGTIEKINRLRVGHWTGIPKGCNIELAINQIGWNKAVKVDYGRNFDKYVTVCTRINDRLNPPTNAPSSVPQ